MVFKNPEGTAQTIPAQAVPAAGCIYGIAITETYLVPYLCGRNLPIE